MMVRVTCVVSFLSFSVICSAQHHGFDVALTPFFENHCFNCHDDETAKGGLDLFALENDLSDEKVFAKWERVYDKVSKGEMPPEKKPRPTREEMIEFRRNLAIPLADVHRQQKGTVLRRLNRNEYQNTLNDIFGTKTDLISLLPEDGRSHEFDNIGSALGVSMVQLERYLEGINTVLDESIANTPEPPEITILKANYVDSREGERHIPTAWGKAPDGAVLFYRKIGYPTGMLRGSGVRKDGYYRIRVTGYAHNSEKPITFGVGGSSFAPGSAKPTYGYFSFNPGKPQTIELTQLIRERYMVEITPYGLKDEGNYIKTRKTTKGYRGPALAINHVEVEGPLYDQFPSKGHQLLFDGINREVKKPVNKWRPVFEIKSTDPRSDATETLLRVATKAW